MLAEAFASDPAWSSQVSPHRLPHVHHEAAANKVLRSHPVMRPSLIAPGFLLGKSNTTSESWSPCH